MIGLTEPPEPAPATVKLMFAGFEIALPGLVHRMPVIEPAEPTVNVMVPSVMPVAMFGSVGFGKHTTLKVVPV